jgi:hypothetical protein
MTAIVAVAPRLAAGSICPIHAERLSHDTPRGPDAFDKLVILDQSPIGRTLNILDQPTTSLHFADIDLLLLCVLHPVRDAGNTIVVIEHNWTSSRPPTG